MRYVTSFIPLIIWFIGCSTIGTGTRVVLKAQHHADAFSFYPTLIASPNESDFESRIVVIPPETNISSQDFNDFITKRYGNRTLVTADLSATIRDRASMPPFLPVDISKSLVDSILPIYKDESKLSEEQKIEKENLLKARLLNVPDLPHTTSLHHYENGREVYFYYPRVQVDFSGRLLSNVYSEQFNYLGMIIRINNIKSSKVCSCEFAAKCTDANIVGKKCAVSEYPIRFVDFSPKLADMVEYSRGTSQQAAQLQAKGTAGATRGGEETTATPIPGIQGGTVTSKLTGGRALGGELSYTFSETYAAELKDAIEKRSAAILENGKVFVAEFRAIREKRIGGTYNFDLMLEIPAIIRPGQPKTLLYTSEPVTNRLDADIYLIGVVRHIRKHGTRGFFTRVPEIENDDTYETVTLNVLKDQTLWLFTDSPWTGYDRVQNKSEIKINILTNRDDAMFLVTDLSGNLLGKGKGKEAIISVDNKGDDTQPSTFRDLKVTFMPIVSEIAGQGTVLRLSPPVAQNIKIKSGESGIVLVEGYYFK
jgi:hypothetical protein